jgi:hypothetical protein
MLDAKLGIWCAMIANRTTGQILSDHKRTSACHKCVRARVHTHTHTHTHTHRHHILKTFPFKRKPTYAFFFSKTVQIIPCVF